MNIPYNPIQPERSEIEAIPGLVALDFGANWCGHCKAAAPLIDAALAELPSVTHIKVEDGSGRPLGRAFRVKLWPTVVLLRDGVERARVVRPDSAEQVREALAQA